MLHSFSTSSLPPTKHVHRRIAPDRTPAPYDANQTTPTEVSINIMPPTNQVFANPPNMLRSCSRSYAWSLVSCLALRASTSWSAYLRQAVVQRRRHGGQQRVPWAAGLAGAPPESARPQQHLPARPAHFSTSGLEVSRKSSTEQPDTSMLNFSAAACSESVDGIRPG